MRRISPGAALLPLRLFLGVTFIYAGVQKLSDPGYLHPGAPTYIGTQLHGFANGTPGGFLLRAFALPQPKLAGVGVALIEIAIGVLVTAGLVTRVAAAAGLALNFVLFLTNSWNASPYFLGSDIVFVFAWLPFVLTGASGQPALDTMLAARERSAAPPRRARRLSARGTGARAGPSGRCIARDRRAVGAREGQLPRPPQPHLARETESGGASDPRDATRARSTRHCHRARCGSGRRTGSPAARARPTATRATATPTS